MGVVFGWLLSFLITYPFIRMSSRNDEKVADTILSPDFVALITSLIPFYNLYLGAKCFNQWLALKIVAWKLRKIGKQGHPSVKDDLEKVAKMIDDMSKLK